MGWGLAPGTVLHTTDAGRTWHDVTPPAGLGAVDTDFALPEPGAFLNWNDAWVPLLGPVTPHGRPVTIAATHDGGRTWEATPLPHDLGVLGPVQLDFADPRHGWVLLDLSNGMGHYSSALFRTVDGGAHWVELVQTLPLYPHAAGVSDGGFPDLGLKTGIAFPDSGVGWVTGSWGAPGAELYMTQDDGRTWSRRNVPLPPGLSADGAGSLALLPLTSGAVPSLAMAACVGGGPGGAKVALLWPSGATGWVPAPPVRLDGPVSCLALNWGAPGPGVAWVADGAHLYVTRDAGQTWTTVTPNVTFPAGTSISFFPEEGLGWAAVPVGDGGGRHILRSVDGGQTWGPADSLAACVEPRSAMQVAGPGAGGQTYLKDVADVWMAGSVPDQWCTTWNPVMVFPIPGGLATEGGTDRGDWISPRHVGAITIMSATGAGLVYFQTSDGQSGTFDAVHHLWTFDPAK